MDRGELSPDGRGAGSPSAVRRLRDSVPPAVAGGLVDPGRRSVVVLAAVGLVAALFAAAYLWRSQPEPVAVPVRAPLVSGSTAQAPAVAGRPSPSPSVVVVDVGGEIADPGVYRLPAGSRVVDALEAAGGAESGADTTAVNLARPLVDGEKILVGVPRPPGLAGPAGGSVQARADAEIDVNTATPKQLEELPGIGEVLAQRIVEYRTEHGPFESVTELNGVSGIGEKTLADIEDEVRV